MGNFELEGFMGSGDTARYCFNVASAGVYKIGMAVYTPDASSDTLFVTVDGQPTGGYIWDIVSGAGYYDYVNARDLADPAKFYLSAGQHTVTLHMREDGVQMDTIELIPTPLVENGNFEAGKTPWQFWADPGNAAAYTLTTSSPNEGTKSARLSMSNAGGEYSLYGDVSLTGGQPYRLSFAVRSNTGNDFHVWTLKDDGIWETTYGLDQVIDLTTPNQWYLCTYSFTPTGFTGTVLDGILEFWPGSLDANGDKYDFDAISLVPDTTGGTSGCQPQLAGAGAPNAIAQANVLVK